jgi:hypothetical protein
MNTVGTSCVLITTRLSQKENQNLEVAVFFVVADQAPVNTAG